jgi:hypothetical protein
MRPLNLLFIIAVFALTAFSSCELLDDEDEVTPSSSSSGTCTGGYKSPVKDAQLDAFCGAAYAYRCLDGKSLSNSQVQSVCSSYNSLKVSGVASCSYCN